MTWPSVYLRGVRTTVGGGRRQKETAMNLTPSGSVPTRRGSADSFTGTVWQDPIIEAPSPARIRASRVTFEHRRTDRLAHPPAGANPARALGSRTCSSLGRSDPRNHAGRHRVDPTWREALARRGANDCDGPHCDAGGTRRRARRLAGKSH